MKVAVLGAGAIGAYVGAMLARGGTETALIARGAHGAAMADYGVRLLGDGAEVAVRMPVTDDPGQVGRVDVVFLGLKAHQYAAAGPLLDPLLGPETAVVAAQNGIPWWYFHGHGGPHDGRRIDSVDPGGAVSGVIPPERAIGCVVYASTEIVEPGVIRHIEDIRFPVGEPAGGTSDRCAAFSAAMRAGGLKAPVARDIRQQIWLKLMGNAVFNPLSVLTRATMGEICASGPARGAVLFAANAASLLESAGEALFDPAWWRARGALAAVSGGRGSAWFVGQGADHWVLRHYRRGGLPGQISMSHRNICLPRKPKGLNIPADRRAPRGRASKASPLAEEIVWLGHGR